jgi:imidazolonepropionase-like amidohydrolase
MPSRRLSRVLHVAALVVAATASPTGPSAHASSPAEPVVAITHATILTVTKGTIPDGTVIVRGGRIAEVGRDVSIPSGAEVIDANGRFVSPGIIDCHSHIAADSINEGGTTVSSMTGIEDVFNPIDIDIYRDLAGGLTTANVLHGSANPIGGKNYVIKLRWGKPHAEDFKFEGAMPGIKFALGENPKDMRQFGQQGPRRYPSSRLGVEYVIRDAFTRAKAYQAAWRDYDAKKKAGDNVLAPRRDLQLEPLVEVLEGKRLVHAHCYRSDEILMLLRLADEMGFKVATLQHALEAYRVAPEIKAHGAGVSTFADWWGYKVEASGATPYNAAMCLRRGIVVSINSDSAEHARRLNTEAAKMIKYGGLSEDEALALVTINPAKQLRIDNRVGSIEVGKDADLVIWNHHPLSSYALPDRVYIDGTLYYDRTKEDQRVSDIKTKKEALLKAEKEAAEKAKAEKAGEGKGPSGKGAGEGPSGEGPAGKPGGDVELPAGRGVSLGEGHGGGASTGSTFAWNDVTAVHRWNDAPTIAITNARIVPVTSPVIEKGTIVMKGGRIVALGPDVAVPPGADVIDATGSEVYPGWIEPNTSLGLDEPGPRGFQDTSEQTPLNPELRTRVAFHIESDGIPVARSNGVTTVGVAPDGGILGGEVAVMNLDGWTWEQATLRNVAGISMQFPPIRPARRFGAPPPKDESYDDMKKARDRKLDDVAALLARAHAYSAMPSASRPTDWVLESLVPVVDNALPVFVNADTESDIKDAVAFADRAKIRIVIVGGAESALVASLLKQKNIPVVFGPVQDLPTRQDFHQADRYRAPAALAEAGVKFAFTIGGDETFERNLPYQAAEGIAWGLSRDAALRALTIYAAAILGVDKEVGSLEPGKLANLFIARGDPLEVRTEVTEVIVAGRRVGVDNIHRQFYEKWSKRP